MARPPQPAAPGLRLSSAAPTCPGRPAPNPAAAAGLLAASAASSAAKFVRDMRDEAVQQKRRLLWKMANSRCGRHAGFERGGPGQALVR